MRRIAIPAEHAVSEGRAITNFAFAIRRAEVFEFVVPRKDVAILGNECGERRRTGAVVTERVYRCSVSVSLFLRISSREILERKHFAHALADVLVCIGKKKTGGRTFDDYAT